MSKLSTDATARPAWRYLCPLYLFACTPDPAAQSTEDPVTTASSTTGDSAGSSDESGSSGPPTTGGAETSAPPLCGDSQVDPDEACDDGNDINGDGCNRDCQPSATQVVEYRSDAYGDIYSLAADPNGTVLIGGTQGGSAWVARFDDTLTQQWAQLYEGQHGLARAVAYTEGAILAAGSKWTDADSHDLWVARLDPDGVVEWEDIVSGGEGDDWATQVAVLDGDLVVTGLAFADQLWTRRYGPDGAIKWTASIPLGNTYKNIWPLGPGMAVRADAVLAGWSQFSVDNYYETLFAMGPADGASTWTVQGQAVSGGYNAIAIDSGGDLALVSPQQFDILAVTRTTSAGAPIWTSNKCVGNNGRDVAIDNQGDIVVIGDGKAKGGTNIRLCKFSPDGTLRWGKDIDGGAGDDRGHAVVIDTQDRIVAGGQVYVGTDDRRAWLAIFSP